MATDMHDNEYIGWGGAYTFLLLALSHLTIDHTSLSRRGTTPAPRGSYKLRCTVRVPIAAMFSKLKPRCWSDLSWCGEVVAFFLHDRASVFKSAVAQRFFWLAARQSTPAIWRPLSRTPSLPPSLSPARGRGGRGV